MLKLLRTKSTQTILLLLVLIFLAGIVLRNLEARGANLVFDFDQIEDQFYTYTVAHDFNPAIIGRAVYGDPRLHHGVFYYYYNFIPFLISNGNFYASLYWNQIFNVSTGIILFILARQIFKKNLVGIIAALLTAVSFEFIKFSNWLTIDTPVIFLIPLFYLGLWGWFKQKRWSYALIPISLALSIQCDLSTLYLIPVGLIFWALFRPKFPNLKTSAMSIGFFLIFVSTLIATEIKLNFAGIKFMLNFSGNFQSATNITYPERFVLFFEDFFANFSHNLMPAWPYLGMYLAFGTVGSAIYHFYSKKTSKEERIGIKFLLFYLFSPLVTLILGYHDTPWFLIGLPGAVILICSFVISKFKPMFMVPILMIIILSNIYVVIYRPAQAYKLFDHYYDPSSYLAYQLQVIDYTYAQANGAPFGINSVTYPLYYNAMWEYLYNWYGKEKYGYVPVWLGGEQPYPYNLLPTANNPEETYFILISQTGRIPKWEEDNGKIWGAKYGRLLEEKNNPGFLVQKYGRIAK